jgi:hypothetical protein
MRLRTIPVLGLLTLTAAWSSADDACGQQLLMPRVGGYNTVQADPIPNPTVSPYLLLTDVGQSGSLNYQTLVQPLVQQRLLANQQNNSISRLGQQVKRPGQDGPSKRSGQSIGDTGHETRYLNYSHYYNSVAR